MTISDCQIKIRIGAKHISGVDKNPLSWEVSLLSFISKRSNNAGWLHSANTMQRGSSVFLGCYFGGGKQILRARHSYLLTQTSCSGISVAIGYTSWHLGCLVEL